jgi:ribosomal protein S18 acetylase RimI-like enzyme
MKLTPMTEDEYLHWSTRSRAKYAAEKMKANHLSKEQAEKIASQDFERNLPDGLHSKDSFLFSLREENQSAIGYVWLLVRGPENDRRAFIGDVVIEEQYRGKGYGKKIMLLLEDEAKKRGLNRMGLHVFGSNETAILLYKKLGYITTDLVMEKVLHN